MAAVAKIGLKVLSLVVGIPVGIATRKAVEQLWATARPAGTPRKPDDPGVDWADAIAWAALSGVGIVVADMLTRRGAAVAFEAITGSNAPPAKASKGPKKLAKASEKSPATAD